MMQALSVFFCRQQLSTFLWRFAGRSFLPVLREDGSSELYSEENILRVQKKAHCK